MMEKEKMEKAIMEIYEKLNHWTGVQKEWDVLQKKKCYEIRNVSDHGLMISEEWFAFIVNDQNLGYSVIDRNDDTFRWQFEAVYNGAKIYCITSNKFLLSPSCAGEV